MPGIFPGLFPITYLKNIICLISAVLDHAVYPAGFLKKIPPDTFVIRKQLLIENGADIKDMQERLGHANIATFHFSANLNALFN